MSEHLEDADDPQFISFPPASPWVCRPACTQSALEGGGGGRKTEKDPSFFPCLPPPLTEELIHLPGIKAKFRFVFIRIYIQNVLEFLTFILES